MHIYFPAGLTQGLSDANAEQLASIEVTPSGEGLHFEKLDEDYSLPSLMIGIFGNKNWMSQIKKNVRPAKHFHPQKQVA